MGDSGVPTRRYRRGDLMVHLIRAGLLLALLAAPCSASDFGPYRIAAPVAVDGDTIKGEIMLWPSPLISALVLVRVAGIDTPELRGNGQRVIPECEKVLARAAMAFTQQWLERNHPVTITDVLSNKYGSRVDATVRGPSGNLLAGALLAAGHARISSASEARKAWCP